MRQLCLSLVAAAGATALAAGAVNAKAVLDPVPPEAAAPPVFLTLEEAIGRALQESPLVADLKSGLELAALDLKRAQDAYKTKAYLFGNSDARTGAEVGRTLRAGVTRRLLGGSRWTMGVSNASFGETYLSEVSVGYTLPLFQNPIATGRFTLEEAELGYRQRQGQTELGIEDLLLQVIAAYYELALAANEVQVAEGAIALAERLERATSIRVRTGRSSQLDLQLARLRVAQGYQRRQATTARRALAANRLKLLLGVDFAQPLDVDSEIPLPSDAGSPLLTAAALEQLALDRRADLMNLKDEVSLAQRRASESGSRFPGMDITLQYARVGDGTSFSESSSLDEGRFGVGVSFDMTAQGDIASESRRLFLQYEGRQRALARLEAEIRGEVQAGLFELRDAEGQLRLARQNRTLAQQQLRLAEILYTKGTATTEEMLEKQQALSDSRQQELAARVRLLVASYRLERATGSLLERWRS